MKVAGKHRSSCATNDERSMRASSRNLSGRSTFPLQKENQFSDVGVVSEEGLGGSAT